MKRRSRGGPAPLRLSIVDAGAQSPFVLIVEDHAETLDAYAMYFLSFGFKVQTAMDGEQAVARALGSSPDVIVINLSLPRLDGWEASPRLKSDPRTRHIPIVACTAHGFGDPVERAIEVGVDAYVVKPCEPHDLLRKVTRVLRRAAVNRQRQA